MERELLPGTGVAADAFWGALERILADFTPRNAALLQRRDALQVQIDAWRRARRGQQVDVAEETAFLREIGYLLPEPPDFQISTRNVDPEIAQLAGPQLVVPVSNGRYALNAANARWGSLYEALYGTDALALPTGGQGLRPRARRPGDRLCPRLPRSRRPAVERPASPTPSPTPSADQGLVVRLSGGLDSGAGEPGAAGRLERRGRGCRTPSCCATTALHPEIQIDGAHLPSARTTPAGVADVLVEAALTGTSRTREDSVATVDAEDKTCVHRNWLGLMRGDLSASFAKGGRTETRRLDEDRLYQGACMGRADVYAAAA